MPYKIARTIHNIESFYFLYKMIGARDCLNEYGKKFIKDSSTK